MHRPLAILLSSTLVLQVAPLGAQTSRGVGVRSAKSAVLAGTNAVAQTVMSGTITGTTRGATGDVLARHTVQVRSLQTGNLAGSTTSDAAGGFSFSSLTPGNYVVELVNPAGAVVGSSSSIAVAAGATSTMTVGLAAAAVPAAAAAGAGISTAVVVTSIAAAAGIAGAVVIASDASPSR